LIIEESSEILEKTSKVILKMFNILLWMMLVSLIRVGRIGMLKTLWYLFTLLNVVKLNACSLCYYSYNKIKIEEDRPMLILIFSALAIAIIAVIFALQNLTVVSVSLFFWKIDSSLALVLLVTLAVGVLISLMASLPGLIRGKFTIKNQKKKLEALETERKAFQLKADTAENEVKTLEEQLASLSAEIVKQQTNVTPPPEGLSNSK
jgi:lipopolysaccharide assembly protein A